MPPPPVPDAAPPPPVAIARGGACGEAAACGAGLFCLPAPGGYCASSCGLIGTACDDGACVATARGGELCLQGCTADTDCRADEGYVCDPQWHACLLPNLAAIIPHQCPAPAGGGRDPAFAASTQLTTSATPGVYQFEPTAVLTADGGVFALYISRGAIDAPNVLGSARTGPRAVSDQTFTTGRDHQFDPWLARDRSGRLYAVALAFDARDKNQRISLTTSDDDGVTWTPPVAAHEPADCVDGTPDCLDKPMVVVGPAPKGGGEVVYVLYSAEDGLRVRASRDRGATFGPAVTAQRGIYGNATVDRDGRLHIITLAGGPGTGAFGSADHAIEYTTSSDGGRTFAQPRPLQRRDEMLPFFFSNPSIVVDSRRKWIYAAYTRGGRDAVWDLVVLASKDRGKTWRRARIGDTPACAIHMVPNLALDPTTGTLHVAWYDSRGTPGRFAHATCTPGLGRCKELGAINDRPFAALTTERHAPRWIGEYEALVIDDRRRTLHAVWAQPVDEDGRIVSRIFHAAAKLPRR